MLAVELDKAKEREKKLEAALHEVFPLDLYTQVRPDVKDAFNGEPKKIIDHFIRIGIKEIDIKEESKKNKLDLYQNVKEAALLLSTKLDRVTSALLKVFPFHRYAEMRPDAEAASGETKK